MTMTAHQASSGGPSSLLPPPYLSGGEALGCGLSDGPPAVPGPPVRLGVQLRLVVVHGGVAVVDELAALHVQQRQPMPRPLLTPQPRAHQLPRVVGRGAGEQRQHILVLWGGHGMHTHSAASRPTHAGQERPTSTHPHQSSLPFGLAGVPRKPRTACSCRPPSNSHCCLMRAAAHPRW